MILGSIESLIPHRYPIICIDELLEVTEDYCYSVYTVPGTGIFIEDDKLCIAGVLETVAQTAAAGSGFNLTQNGDQVSESLYLAGFRNVLVNGDVYSGSVLKTKIFRMSDIMNISSFRAEVKCEGTIVLNCELMVVKSGPKL